MANRMNGYRRGAKPHQTHPYRPEFGEEICRQWCYNRKFESLTDFCEKHPNIKDASVLSQWAKKYPEFKENLQWAKSVFAERLVWEATRILDACDEQVENKDVKKARARAEHYRWLATKYDPSWSEKHMHEVSGPNGSPIQQQVTDERSEDRARERIDAILSARGEGTSN